MLGTCEIAQSDSQLALQRWDLLLSLASTVIVLYLHSTHTRARAHKCEFCHDINFVPPPPYKYGVQLFDPLQTYAIHAPHKPLIDLQPYT